MFYDCFSSEEEMETRDNAARNTSLHAEIVSRLLTFLDYTTRNAANTRAWDLLAGSLRILLLAGEAGRQAARETFAPDRRQSWWLDTHAQLVEMDEEKREARCVAKQLTVFDLLLGSDHPLSRRVETCLQRRGGVTSLLAERGAFAGRVTPLLPAVVVGKGANLSGGGSVVNGENPYEAFLAAEWDQVNAIRQRKERERLQVSPVLPGAAPAQPRTGSASPQPRHPTRNRYVTYPFLRSVALL
jgi:hypothetical protein